LLSSIWGESGVLWWAKASKLAVAGDHQINQGLLLATEAQQRVWWIKWRHILSSGAAKKN